VLVSCDKILKKKNSKKERFILAHSGRGFSPWSASDEAEAFMVDGVEVDIHSPHESQETERGRGQNQDIAFLGAPPSDLIPPTRFHHLVSITSQCCPEMISPSID
jgi:hypothetical protein